MITKKKSNTGLDTFPLNFESPFQRRNHGYMIPLLIGLWCDRTHGAEHRLRKAAHLTAVKKQTHPLRAILKDPLLPTRPCFPLTHPVVNPSVEDNKHPHDSQHLSKCHQVSVKPSAHIITNYNEYQHIPSCLCFNALSSQFVCSHHQQLLRTMLTQKCLKLNLFFPVSE